MKMARLIIQLLKYLTTINFFFNYCTANETKELKIRTLPVYSVVQNAELLNPSRCRSQLIEFREAIDEHLLWGIKVMDASGEPKSGFIYGNNYWLGSKSQCEDAGNRNPFQLSVKVLQNNSRYRRIEDEFPPFDVKFFVANFRHNSTLQYHIVISNEDLIILGMCLPASCSKDQLSVLLETVLRNRTLFIGELYSADFKLVEVRDLIDDHRWLLSGTFITMTIVVVLTLLLMVIGTTYDIQIYQKQLKKNDICLEERGNVNPPTSEELETLNENNQDKLEKLKRNGIFCKIFLAFSAYSNTKIIFNTKSEDVGIPVIHGLRFLSMIWVILIHIFFYSKDFYDNRTLILRTFEDIFIQSIPNGTIAVDTFFCFGGFLVSYLYFKRNISKDVREQRNYLNVVKLYLLTFLKRFIRLTPSFMVIIGLQQIMFTWYSKTSVFYLSERSHETCQKYWWRNILYIHNFFSLRDMCLSWSWYLANDMQFFLVINFLLYLSSTYFKLAASLLGLLLSSSLIFSGYISYTKDYIPTVERIYNLFEPLYFLPWARIGPYLIGVIAAYIVFKLNNKLLWNKKTIILFWILSSLCNISLLFGLYKNKLSLLAAAFYVALHRTVWAIGIAWIIIACCTNNGGIVNCILSWKVWIPLSRLTYAGFLINPFLISFVYFLNENALHSEFLISVIVCIGYIVIIYICSYVMSLMFELPYIILIKEMMQYLRRKI